MLDSVALRARLSDVRDRIARAADRAGRDPASVHLIAVSKTFDADHVRALADCGQTDFGENKVQEALPKMEQTADLRLVWHLVGHLQSNKARRAAANFHVIHSVDSADLVGALDAGALASGRSVDALVQVDLARESTKFGAEPASVPPIYTAATSCLGVRLHGLMLVPPAVNDADDARPYFARLRALRDDLAAGGIDRSSLDELSMGMSHDFEVAIEEGSTLVRVGTAIFGERTYV